ncbi:rab proteins geranylgeranyltransferase component A 1-like [Lingula anatina]|uniref:Rab proteins geranylgeranyltransferase component A 1-like n=1 Tax=Lingula anatina TaxID=7574 RepID=A0A2R2MQM3_LINAN|nr:rab proteins geranylgeranyltransferase component A 1-like [Lingula anatina]|eukprot:XP_023932554.1 rab proteins geranylgeranyltransferase component A 1-like [Lingula anatina]
MESMEGLTECVIAAALARIGFRVLHLDRNDYYSSEWAVFNFDGMQRWIKQEQTRALEKEAPFSSEPYQELLEDGEVLIPLPQHGTGTSNVVEKVFMKEAPADIVEVEDKTSKLSLASEAAPNITSQETTESSEIDSQNVDNLLQDSDMRFEDTVVSETVSQGDHSTQSQGKDQPLTESEEQSENAKIGQEKNEENSVGQLDGAEATGKMDEQPKSDKTEPNYDNVEFVVQESDHKAQGAGVKVAEKEPKKPDKVREWTLSELKKEWRRFNLDLAPKVCG